MAVISNSTVIACTPEEAFDYFVDIRNELEWNPDAVSMEKLTSGPVGLGTKFRAKWKRSAPLDVECVEYERPNRWVHLAAGPMSIRFTGRVDRDGDKTRLSVEFDARPRGWSRLVFPLFLLIMKRQERANMAYCRTALERRLAATSADDPDARPS